MKHTTNEYHITCWTGLGSSWKFYNRKDYLHHRWIFSNLRICSLLMDDEIAVKCQIQFIVWGNDCFENHDLSKNCRYADILPSTSSHRADLIIGKSTHWNSSSCIISLWKIHAKFPQSQSISLQCHLIMRLIVYFLHQPSKLTGHSWMH